MANLPSYVEYPEEGERCLKVGCEGSYEFGGVENCSCHLCAPCSAHISQELTCDVCGMEPEEGYWDGKAEGDL